MLPTLGKRHRKHNPTEVSHSWTGLIIAPGLCHRTRRSRTISSMEEELSAPPQSIETSVISAPSVSLLRHACTSHENWHAAVVLSSSSANLRNHSKPMSSQ